MWGALMVREGLALVSIVIPAYNAERFLGETLASVLSQTHRNLEVLVVDDGSTDGTAAVAQACNDSRVRVISKRNGGLSSARNAGIDGAQGEVIAFVDADDLWDSEKVARQLCVLRDPGVVAVGSRMRYVAAESGRTFGSTGESVAGRQDEIRAGRFMPFAISSALFEADAVRRAGPFDEDLPQVEDLDFLARIARLGRVEALNEILGSYRVHATSMTAQAHGEQRLVTRFVQQRIAMVEAGERPVTLAEFRMGYRPTVAERRRDYGAIRFRAAGLAAVNGNRAAAMRHIAVAAAVSPVYTLRRFAQRLAP